MLIYCQLRKLKWGLDKKELKMIFFIRMNKTLIIILIVVAVFGVGYMFILGNKKQPETQTTVALPEQQPTATPEPVSYSIDLSEQNASGEYGKVTLSEESGKVKVAISLTGAPQDVTQPAHIHIGSCPEVGAVKYPLTFPVNGTSETSLDLTLDQLKSELPLSVNVHKSAQEAKVYVACADLSF